MVIDYMYNIDGDTCTAFIDRGNPAAGEDVHYYNDAETAVRKLRRMGFEF